jgi:hypothetical protein
MVLREENVVGEYFEQILDLLVGMKNGFVNRQLSGPLHPHLNISELASELAGSISC